MNPDEFAAQAARESAFLQGREAHGAGIGKDANPFRPIRTTSDDEWAHAWDLGWRTAAVAAGMDLRPTIAR